MEEGESTESESPSTDLITLVFVLEGGDEKGLLEESPKLIHSPSKPPSSEAPKNLVGSGDMAPAEL